MHMDYFSSTSRPSTKYTVCCLDSAIRILPLEPAVVEHKSLAQMGKQINWTIRQGRLLGFVEGFRVKLLLRRAVIGMGCRGRGGLARVRRLARGDGRRWRGNTLVKRRLLPRQRLTSLCRSTVDYFYLPLFVTVMYRGSRSCAGSKGFGGSGVFRIGWPKA